MELAKIRNLSDEELAHQERTSSEQLFRLRFQVSMGQNDGVKKLRELRKEIAQIKTVARERELGIHGELKEAEAAAPATENKAKQAAPVAEAEAGKATPAAEKAEKKARKAKAPAAATEKKTAKAKGARK
jgi:large subunit ribosomal protein L29